MDVKEHEYLERPEVTLQLISRKLTLVQTDAGKRLFKKLIARAREATNNEIINKRKAH